ncbi:hypothetical protein BX591_106136 [Paraburkholderia bryophila]|uniref:Uncharacterized protein n=1 Tax=Paraburkholderia bryophila TaxID=420952 RepID=A0A329CUG2_9BURK|nr:hypothetical protein BX591_106136 [Paraburkholderia bryophila]
MLTDRLVPRLPGSIKNQRLLPAFRRAEMLWVFTLCERVRRRLRRNGTMPWRWFGRRSMALFNAREALVEVARERTHGQLAEPCEQRGLGFLHGFRQAGVDGLLYQALRVVVRQ